MVTPETAFTNAERYTLLRLMQMVEEQGDTLKQVTEKLKGNNATAGDPGPVTQVSNEENIDSSL